MKQLNAFILIAVLAGCASTPKPAAAPPAAKGEAPARPAAAAASPKDVHAALDAVLGYKYGESREPLSVVEDFVHQAAAGPDQGAALAGDVAGLLSSSKATHDAKDFFCRQLRLIGTEKEAGALAALLHDPTLSDIARWALQSIPGEGVNEALTAALKRGVDAKTEVGVIDSLGERGATSAVEILAAIAHDKAGTDSGNAALAALSKIGAPAAKI